MILSITITYGWNEEPFEEDGISLFNVQGVETFVIDTDKFQAILDGKVEGYNADDLHYTRSEIEEAISVTNRGGYDLSEGHDKYSLYDTDFEYQLIKADPDAKIDHFLDRTVHP